MNKKIKVAILCGGPSSEYEVSLNSGQNVWQNLDKQKYDADLIKISRNGEFFLKNKKLNVFSNGWVESDLKKYDIVFLALHGEFGEDGKIQAILDLLKIPYTCSGVLASAWGMNKNKTNLLVKKYGLRVPKTLVFNKNFSEDKILSAVEKDLGFPLVVKPNKAGSSVGITIVKKPKDLFFALKEAFQGDVQILLQEFVSGQEFTCGILGNSDDENLEVLPPVEIKPGREFFDYEAKYKDETTLEICPAQIPNNLAHQVQAQAMLVHKLLGCDGLTRSDFIFNKEKGLYFLEINTIPGLTTTSLCPKEAVAAGYTYTDFLDKIIELALNKKSYVKSRFKSA